ncbi:class I SAM-dependent methyltransferase [Roseiflexus sp.]|uniref:class I SAM-dependent methyltransferase n=1 Tax=Roseiflexus sp. TaxID=2562120 RepID=UPI00398B2AB7
MQSTTCPSCGMAGMDVFYELERVPAHSVLLLPTREEAVRYPRGDIRLGFCRTCGFISNTAFDPSLHEYSDRYEETQGYSPTFNAFARRLAEHLIARYDLHGKDILEIGCGKGEFITLLCELGENRGIGIDPAYVAERSLAHPSERVTFITDFYSERYAHLHADFVVCKMTLEHIHDTAGFVGMVRRALDGRPYTTVFFQIPDTTRVLEEIGFWDIYYEHCSYFTPGSLARLFRRCGFDVIDLWRDYGDQYLMIEAQPGSGRDRTFPELEDDLERTAADVDIFRREAPQVLRRWREYLAQQHAEGRKVVLWGSGSKGVAFLTTLGIEREIVYTVDINPNKHGTCMAGTGQQIVAPSFLCEYRPDAVIVMNPIYVDEIQRELSTLRVTADVLTVERFGHAGTTLALRV